MSGAVTETEGAAKSAPVESHSEGRHFDWPLAYDAENLLKNRVEDFLRRNSFARRLANRMRDETGTDFFEWIDHLALSPEDEPTLHDAGFEQAETTETASGGIILEHPRATLPRVILRASTPGNPSMLSLRPERVADFMARNNLAGEIEGPPYSRYRRLTVSEENGARLDAVERRAYRGFVPAPLSHGQLEAIVQVKEFWHTRQRVFAPDQDGFRAANRLLDVSIPAIGRDSTCQIFFEEERAYWESRNRAARIQKHRQDQLGLGWGNHDHHTYRCSREHFVDLVEFFQKLGFIKRERFYAGAEAGWGAQIFEHAVTGIVVFADVDLMPDETQIDFSTQPLPPAPRLGTVGLWVGLHGESFFEAGMHHLEARFDHALLREQLKDEGVQTMSPFSDFDFLRQAFTEGEPWPVRRERAERLLAAKLITSAQFEKFMAEGAIGSHLENLQRRGGFKGFNQKSVSVIIAATDPRNSHFAQA